MCIHIYVHLRIYVYAYLIIYTYYTGNSLDLEFSGENDSEEDVMIDGMIKENDRYIYVYMIYIYVYIYE
jgi:hypothetical protein